MKLSKSKLALAEVINENGGWPQDSEWAVQNGDHGRISLSINKPARHDSKSWMAKGGFNFKIEVCKPLKNWHQCVLNREEYYHAYPRADVDRWIEWSGGECPVEGSSIVDVELSDGRISSGLAISFSWLHEWAGGNIIKYRKHKKPKAQPECLGQINPIIPASIDELCAKVTEENKHQHVDAKPTIEQLAQDYRNAKGHADRLQKEAGEAAAKAEEFAVEIRKKLLELQELIGIPNPEKEHELEITDWRDLMVGDEVECTKYATAYRFGVVCRIDESSEEQPIMVNHGDGKGTSWPSSWKFIRRP